jgi:hypothetical protein
MNPEAHGWNLPVQSSNAQPGPAVAYFFVSHACIDAFGDQPPRRLAFGSGRELEACAYPFSPGRRRAAVMTISGIAESAALVSAALSPDGADA